MRFKYNTIYNNKNSLDNIRNEFESRFICLNKEALKSLVTAEYQYNKENEYIDYSGVFLCYIKGFEIEIRSRLKRKNKMTLKELISNLNKIPELITFVKALNKINIIEIRNKGVHNSITTKVQCGILRKLLLEDRWLDRTIQILNDVENEGFVSIDREVYIEEIEDDEWYEGKFYRCGRTADGLYILSKSILGIGNYKVQGQLINNYGINYILIN